MKIGCFHIFLCKYHVDRFNNNKLYFTTYTNDLSTIYLKCRGSSISIEMERSTYLNIYRIKGNIGHYILVNKKKKKV